MGQIINSVSVTVCVRLSTLSRIHFLMIFAKSSTEVTTPKSKNEFVGVNIAPPSPYFAPKNPNFGGVNRRFQA